MKKSLVLLLLFTFLWAGYDKQALFIKMAAPSKGVAAASSQPPLPQQLQIFNAISSQHPVSSVRPLLQPRQRYTMAATPQLTARREAFAAELQKRGMDMIYLVRFENEVEDIELLADILAADEQIEWVELNVQRSIFAEPVIPDDTYYPSQNIDSYLAMEATRGWAIATGNGQVIIAVIDTGVSRNHEDLNVMAGPGSGYDYYNMDDDPDDDNDYSYNSDGVTRRSAFGHGTQVAGHAAAIGDNGKGIVGVIWDAKIMPLKVFDASGTNASIDGVVSAIKYAVDNGADVINMSYGGTGFSSVEQIACDAAYAAGVILVAAMGNSYTQGSSVYYPAGFNSVIGVGATDDQDKIAPFSVYGNGAATTELVAPGVNVLATAAFLQSEGENVTKHPEPYHVASGTSFAAPKVAGLAALLKSHYPSFTNEEIRLIMQSSADDLGSVGYDKYYGYGRINIYRALSLAQTRYVDRAATLKNVYNYPNPIRGGETRFSFEADKKINKVEIAVFDTQGRLRVKLVDYMVGQTGRHISNPWDCKDDQGRLLPNGSYVYVIKATDNNGLETIARSVLSIVR